MAFKTEYVSTEILGADAIIDEKDRDRVKNWFERLTKEGILKLKSDLLVYFKKNQARADRAFEVISEFKAVDGESAEVIMRKNDKPDSHTDI